LTGLQTSLEAETDQRTQLKVIRLVVVIISVTRIAYRGTCLHPFIYIADCLNSPQMIEKEKWPLSNWPKMN